MATNLVDQLVEDDVINITPRPAMFCDNGIANDTDSPAHTSSNEDGKSFDLQNGSIQEQNKKPRHHAVSNKRRTALSEERIKMELALKRALKRNKEDVNGNNVPLLGATSGAKNMEQDSNVNVSLSREYNRSCVGAINDVSIVNGNVEASLTVDGSTVRSPKKECESHDVGLRIVKAASISTSEYDQLKTDDQKLKHSAPAEMPLTYIDWKTKEEKCLTDSNYESSLGSTTEEYDAGGVPVVDNESIADSSDGLIDDTADDGGKWSVYNNCDEDTGVDDSRDRSDKDVNTRITVDNLDNDADFGCTVAKPDDVDILAFVYSSDSDADVAIIVPNSDDADFTVTSKKNSDGAADFNVHINSSDNNANKRLTVDNDADIRNIIQNADDDTEFVAIMYTSDKCGIGGTVGNFDDDNGDYGAIIFNVDADDEIGVADDVDASNNSNSKNKRIHQRVRMQSKKAGRKNKEKRSDASASKRKVNKSKQRKATPASTSMTSSRLLTDKHKGDDDVIETIDVDSSVRDILRKQPTARTSSYQRVREAKMQQKPQSTLAKINKYKNMYPLQSFRSQREQSSTLERQRRRDLVSRFKQLKALLPELHHHKKRVTQLAILKKATECIYRLRNEVESKENHKAQLQARNAFLLSKLEQLYIRKMRK